jgi:hypothetical protein
MLSDFVITLISSSTLTTMLSGLLLWVTRSWISERLKNSIKAEYDTKLESHKALLKAEYDMQVESHKAQLKASSEVEIEKLKSSLKVSAEQRNMTFSHLHTRRVEVIANTYALIKSLHDCVSNYVKIFEPIGGRTKEDRRKDIADASSKFTPYFSQNQIFLPQVVTTAVLEMNQELVTMTHQFFYSVESSDAPDTDKWFQIADKFDGSVKVALKGLEDEFRQLLGDAN